MKRVLIISPYFPPSNTADMQRVRTSLPFYKQFGWEAEVVCVDERRCNTVQDDLLLQSLPAGQVIYKVNGLPVKWTSKIGFGSLGFRSFWFYLRKVNSLLRKNKYDLIYFSTTQFPVCALGAYWKYKFGVPYVIDMQDPWYSDYYRSKPKGERPPKFKAVYSLHKKLEAMAMKKVSGLISVSASYIDELKARHIALKNVPSATITFGSFEPDNEIADDNKDKFTSLLQSGFKNIVYVGRGGPDMHTAITPVFEALKRGLTDQSELFGTLKFYFIGTSYAPSGTGAYTILPLAKQFELEEHVTEITGRIGYYHTLRILQLADALFIPGSDDPQYTASKIYPYLLTRKPLLAIFNSQSSAMGILDEFGAKYVYSYDKTPDKILKISCFLKQVINGETNLQEYDAAAIKKYSARMMTKRQCDLFNKVILVP